MKYILLFFGITLAATAFANQPRCVSLIDKQLKNVGYGSFLHPKSDVLKSSNQEDYVFKRASGPTIRVGSDEVVVIQNTMGLNPSNETKISFDASCNVTEITATGTENGIGGPVPMLTQANPSTCKKEKQKIDLLILAKETLNLSFRDILLYGLCQNLSPGSSATDGENQSMVKSPTRAN